MPVITREDGERFVIPSYRDVLSAKKSSLLKEEVLLLCQNYGNYITLQKKNAQQYEVAFSSDTGYLLGETAWHHFKRPFDMVYCEALPNTNEAILVVVKGGSVYLDGTFPIDSIADELVVFLTQKNNFEIFVYGNVPLSDTATEGKFSFEASHVKSFKVLDAPAFPKFPKLKTFLLQLVDVVLAQHGIGVFPIKNIVGILFVLGLMWMGWNYLTTHKKEIPQVIVKVVSPYQSYLSLLISPSPNIVVKTLSKEINQVITIPGWIPASIKYSDSKLRVGVKSLGVGINVLLQWAESHGYRFEMGSDGFYLLKDFNFTNRTAPKTIYKLDYVVANVVDRFAYIAPGKQIGVSGAMSKGQYKQATLTINVAGMTPATFDLVGQQLTNLPLVLSKVEVGFSKNTLSGTITLLALGN